MERYDKSMEMSVGIYVIAATCLAAVHCFWLPLREVGLAVVLLLARFCTRPIRPVILLDWSGVDLTPKSTPYAKKLVELQDSNAAPDQIYTINSKSWH
ncbi:hypothetical protein V2W45_978028 [Cenococcum geophilum]